MRLQRLENWARTIWRGAASIVLAIGMVCSASSAPFAQAIIRIPNPAIVQIVRNSSPACEPTCPEWISINGGIIPEVPTAFTRVVKSLNGKKLPVVVSSDFGSVDAAVQTGRAIRASGLDTIIGATLTKSCESKSGSCTDQAIAMGHVEFANSRCLSACAIIVAGGINRVGNKESFVGVKQVRSGSYKSEIGGFLETSKEKDRNEDILNGTLQIVSYFKEMGVDPGIQLRSRSTEKAQEISLEDQRALRLITKTDIRPLSLEASSCQDQTMPVNCIRR